LNKITPADVAGKILTMMNDPSQHNAQVYSQHVASYSQRFFELGPYKDSFDTVLALTPQGGRVIELGCGPGNVIHYLLSRRPDLNILGLDLSPEMVRVAVERNGGAAFRVMDLRQAHQIKERFDTVIAAFSIPYIGLCDLQPLIKTFQLITNDSGLLYLSCMEGPPERSGYEKTSFSGEDELFITYYKRGNIEEMLEGHGFSILNFSTNEYREMDGSVTIDLFFTARKQVNK
jgi:predicted TPR repeat methyltransferase